MGYEFDWQNFGVGYGAGLLTAYALYRSRGVFNAIRRSLSSQADSAQSFATMGADRRYSNELTKLAMHSHLFHDKIELADILIEPRFIPDREFATSVDEDDVRRNPFEYVPVVPDHPYLHQPYNVNTISVEELGYGERAVALLGLPGSGRTTALMAIALWSMGKLEFQLPHDPVQERLAEEDSELSRKERDERSKARIAIEQRAKEQLREELGIDYGDEDESAFIPPFRRMAPMYIHLSNVRLSRSDWRGSVDPAEPLIRALQYQSGNVTSKTAPRKMYRFLNDGVALVLLDGFDELSLEEQRQKSAWLEAFLDEYNQNFVIATGPTCGYGILQHVGFTPVHLRPWSYSDTRTYAQKVANHWGSIIDKRRMSVDETMTERITPSLLGLNPHEMTMQIWGHYNEIAQEGDEGEFAEWTQNYLSHFVEDAVDTVPMLARAAGLELDHHGFTLNQWVELEILNWTPPETEQQVQADEKIPDDMEDDEEEDVTFMSPYGEQNTLDALESAGYTPTSGDEEFQIPDNLEEEIEEDAVEEAPKNETKEARSIRRTTAKLLSSLLKSGLVRRYQGNHYRFTHRHIASYLASLTLVNVPDSVLETKANQPNWSHAIAYAAQSRSIAPAVDEKMQNPQDILHSDLADIAMWLRYSDELVDWRNGFLNYMGKMFISPSQYVTSRERIAAALVTSRDSGIKNIFAKGLQNNNDDIRKLSLLGLGTLHDESLINQFNHYLTDNSDEVRVAAALAIGNVHTEIANEQFIEILFETGSENVQQIVTETLADNPEIGYPILWELINDEQYKDRVRIRRAAVLGLRRLRTDWSLIDIYQVYLDDQQWYVKSAAQSAFTERQSRRGKGVQGYPQITALPWLREWSLSLEDESAAEANGIELLNMAMRESDPIIRYLATSNSGQLGIFENTVDIYNLLDDQEEGIRDTAYRALVDLQLRMGKRLPVPG